MIHLETHLVCSPSNYSLSLIVQWGNCAEHKQGEVGTYLYVERLMNYLILDVCCIMGQKKKSLIKSLNAVF